MSRNQSRAFSNKPKAKSKEEKETPQMSKPQPAGPFDFIVPTEIVEIPSKGEFYAEEHPLHNVDNIEIKHMTAKEEDILSSTSLLKKGLAIDKMLQSVIIDKNITVDSLLLGDKNALLVQSRIFGYGADYETTVVCPSCDGQQNYTFDLSELESKELELPKSVERTEQNTFVIDLPKSGMVVEFRLLTSKDEKELSKKKAGGSLGLLKRVILSINEQTDRMYVNNALQSMPILDTSILKKAYAKTMPDIDMSQEVECTLCGEISEMGVPLDANFFWPNF